MKKTFFKAGMIAIAFAIIALAVYMTIGGINEPPATSVDTSFGNHVASQIKKGIIPKDYQASTLCFDALWNEILTESVIALDGKPNISEEEAKQYQRDLCASYVPVLTGYADNVFGKSSWDEDVVRNIASRAQSLLASGAVGGKSGDARLLRDAKKVADAYFRALEAIERASKCESMGSVASVISDVDFCKDFEKLKNERRIFAQLKEAPGEAKKAYAKYLKRKCREVSNDYATYESYEDFTKQFNSLSAEISEYVRKFGDSGQFSEAKSQLAEADSKAQEYYQ